MDNQVPPHFHKDYRIDEKDLIPNGEYFGIVPDWMAPEGTRVHYLNGTDYREYVMLDGTWRVISGITPTATADFFASFLDIVHWSALDGFVVTTGGGAVARVDDAVLFINVTGGAGAATVTGIYGREAYNKLWETGKECVIEWQIAYIDGTDLGLVAWLVMTDVSTTPVVATDDHIGFKLVGTGAGGLNGAVDIYASSGDGAAQTLTNTGVSITFGEIGQIIRRRFKTVFIPGTSCKFYIDDVLVATHTTNLPNVDSPRNNISIASVGSAMGRSMKVNRVLITKQY